jgi:hypothetical protein
MTKETLLAIDREELSGESKEINDRDIMDMIEWLSETEDAVFYPSFQMLQKRSQDTEDIYKYWDTFRNKLKSENSKQRSIGLMMIACNVRWDSENKFEELFDEFFTLLHDEQESTIRQCIVSLRNVVPYTCALHKKIAEKLMEVDIYQLKETVKQNVLKEILEMLVLISNYQKTCTKCGDDVEKQAEKTADKIDEYVSRALRGDLLDKNSKKYIEAIW